MVQFHRPVIAIFTKPVTQDIHISFPALAMKHGQHKKLVPLRLELPVLPARKVISAKQIHKVSKRLLWSTQIFPRMVSEPVTVLTDVLLGPDHVAGVVIEEEVHQGSLWISLGAQIHIIAVLPALTGSESDFPACTSQHQLVLPVIILSGYIFSKENGKFQAVNASQSCRNTALKDCQYLSQQT